MRLNFQRFLLFLIEPCLFNGLQYIQNWDSIKYKVYSNSKSTFGFDFCFRLSWCLLLLFMFLRVFYGLFFVTFISFSLTGTPLIKSPYLLDLLLRIFMACLVFGRFVKNLLYYFWTNFMITSIAWKSLELTVFVIILDYLLSFRNTPLSPSLHRSLLINFWNFQQQS